MNKEALLQTLRTNIELIRATITDAVGVTKSLDNKSLREIKSMSLEDRMTYYDIQRNVAARVEELKHLYSTPYFARCEVTDERGVQKTYFFAKHQFVEHGIYSWVAPAAIMRFEQPGPVSFKLPNRTVRHVQLHDKEQYMIIDGNVLFYAKESLKIPRELIYQEKFSSHKSGFVLPEIVAIMEKAQDTVIRAHHKGAFVISGPAGSGKTTLALHRVAYLAQAPDTGPMYPTESMIVFVQDARTKAYFSTLLPDLGIHRVTITTFIEWAALCLGIAADTLVEHTPLAQQYAKLKIYRKYSSGTDSLPPYSTAHSTYLTKLYGTKHHGIFDRIDLTILMQAYHTKFGTFKTRESYLTPNSEGDIVEKTRIHVAQYALVVVDEFQNYLPETLKLFKKTVHPDTEAVIYVGDMAQRTRLGALRDWSQIGEQILSDRQVTLQKVYRNSRQILEYIRSLGYSVNIPEGLHEGDQVTEYVAKDTDDAHTYTHDIVAQTRAANPHSSIGILGYTRESIAQYVASYRGDTQNTHVLTFAESQGVEFDTVVLVGCDDKMFVEDGDDVVLESSDGDSDSKIQLIQRDLLYVALTRAMTKLYVVGTKNLKSII